jgi:SAM-dependent methyltransferase
MNSIEEPYYQNIARYYDMIHSELTADIEFILSLLEGGPYSVLDLGCGTGRIVFPLARAGHEVLGLDLSEAMLDLAESKLNKETVDIKMRVKLVNDDMTTFNSERRFSLAIICNNTLNELDTDGIKKTFDRIGEHLYDDSLLLIDVANPFVLMQHFEENNEVLERQFSDPESGRLVQQSSSISVDVARQQTQVEWVFETLADEGGESSRISHQATYHLIYPHELELLLNSAGFKLVQMYGNYDREPYGEEGERLIAIASKIDR